jgi:hypothetical protein
MRIPVADTTAVPRSPIRDVSSGRAGPRPALLATAAVEDNGAGLVRGSILKLRARGEKYRPSARP